MRDAILVKEGIVSNEAADDFRFFVKNCMNRQILDQIGGEISSFEKKSFRMAQLNRSRTAEDLKECSKGIGSTDDERLSSLGIPSKQNQEGRLS